MSRPRGAWQRLTAFADRCDACIPEPSTPGAGGHQSHPTLPVLARLSALRPAVAIVLHRTQRLAQHLADIARLQSVTGFAVLQDMHRALTRSMIICSNNFESQTMPARPPKKKKEKEKSTYMEREKWCSDGRMNFVGGWAMYIGCLDIAYGNARYPRMDKLPRKQRIITGQRARKPSCPCLTSNGTSSWRVRWI